MNWICKLIGHKLMGMPDYEIDRPCLRKNCGYVDPKINWPRPMCPPNKKQEIYPITCPKCDHKNEITDSWFGYKYTCPKCSTQFEIEWHDDKGIWNDPIKLRGEKNGTSYSTI